METDLETNAVNTKKWKQEILGKRKWKQKKLSPRPIKSGSLMETKKEAKVETETRDFEKTICSLCHTTPKNLFERLDLFLNIQIIIKH